jgi:formylmethanofuran dehydrogenase subunit A
MTSLRIVGGAIHDPANVIDGEIADLCIQDGRIVASLPAEAPRLDARGMVIMPGGIDMHAHLASSSVNHARSIMSADHAAHPAPAPDLIASGDGAIPRSGSNGAVPSTFTTGYRYAGLGYTTVFDAAVAAVSARETHAQFDDTPIVDAGCFILMGNDAYLHQLLATGEQSQVQDYAAWLLRRAGGYAIKIVNPGGVELWKRNVRTVKSLDDPVGDTKVTPRRILESLAGAADGLNLPHPVHIHGNNLGVAGNVGITLESMAALAGRRAHFTHLQFHSYGGERGRWSSAAHRITDYLAAHPETSGDVGQVMFGQACTLSADGAAEYLLHASHAGTGPWTNVDVELETGCGVVPHSYRERSAVAALQWAIGLELFLLSSDPWRLVMSTDHPNGGSFMSYPAIIHLLMDRSYRDAQLNLINRRMLAGSALADGLDRQYSLNEITIITRAGPARLLGLADKGHLGVGAAADITIYDPDDDRSRMFSTPRYVIKGGTVVVEEGQLRRAPRGDRLVAHPEFDRAIEKGVRSHIERYYSVSYENYGAGALA